MPPLFPPRPFRLGARATLGFLLIGVAAHAAVTPHALFQNNAVLQAGKPMPIWGRADAGEKVTVRFAGQSLTTTAGADGAWRVTLAPRPVNANPADLTIEGTNVVTLKNVVVGEVWLCSGQSNMEFLLNKAANAETELASARYPLIRQFRVNNKLANEPLSALGGNWAPCTPGSATYYTAVGYFFARELHQKLGVPVGIINSSWGGTGIEAWMSPGAFERNPDFSFAAAAWAERLAQAPDEQAEFADWTAEHARKAAEAKARGETYQKPWRREPPKTDGSPHVDKPSAIYNGMVHPLVPYALAGVLWYQGEHNVPQPDRYRRLLPALITDWRAAFGQEKLPFFWVQLPNFRGNRQTNDWVPLREAQDAARALPATGQAVTIDVGEDEDIHPKNKQDVGLRLALLALHDVYKQKVVARGPVYAKATFKRGRATVTFTELGGGLIAKGPSLDGFEIAGEDRVFHPAEARIDGALVVLRSEKVPAPVAVRYAWRNIPNATLYNKADLPAAPFRTDTW